jgi:hypothetical protein
MPRLIAPETVLTLEDSVRVCEYLLKMDRYKGDGRILTIDLIRKYCYQMEEFSSRVFEDIIMPMCPDPWWRYVNVNKYIYKELWCRDEIEGFHLFKDSILGMKDKFSWRRLWTELEYNPEDDKIWVLDVDALGEDLFRRRNQMLEAEEAERLRIEEDSKTPWEQGVIMDWANHFVKTAKAKRKVKARRIKEVIGSKFVMDDPEVPQEVYDEADRIAEIRRGK